MKEGYGMKKRYSLKRKSLGRRIKAGSLALLMFGISMMSASCKKEKFSMATNTDAIEETLESPDLSFMNPSELGIKLNSLQNKAFMEKLTGDFDINEVVRDSNGVLWASQGDLENSKNIGKIIIDTKNGKYVVTKDSKGNTIVKESGVGYQIIDSQGNEIESGNNIPSNYKEIEGTKDLIEKDYTIASKDYYNNEGEVIISKGSVIKNETESRANAELATSKQEAKEVSTKQYVEEKTSSPEQIIQELIRQGVSEHDARIAVLGSDSVPNKRQESVTEVPTTKKQEPVTEVPTTKKQEPVTEVPTTKKQSSGYYEIYGMKFLSEADYQQWVFQDYTGYSEVNGVMVADTKEMDDAYQKSIGGK